MTFSHGFLHSLLESLRGLRAFGTTIAMKAAATLDPACGGFFHLFSFVERMWLCNFCLARHPICTNSKEPCHRYQVGCDAGKHGKTRTEQPFGTITEFTDDDPNWLIFSDSLTPSTSEHNLLCFFWFQNVTIRSINLPLHSTASRDTAQEDSWLLQIPFWLWPNDLAPKAERRKRRK